MLVGKVLRREISVPAVIQDEITTAAIATASPAPPVPNGKHVLNLAQHPGGIAAPYTESRHSSTEIANQLQVSNTNTILQSDFDDRIIFYEQAAILKVYAKFISPDGSDVDYHAAKTSAEFFDYIQIPVQLQVFELAALVGNQRKAFLLNVYNALCIHAMIVLGALKTTL